MATIKPILNYRPDKQGRYTLILQIVHNRRRGVVFSPYHLLPGEFDAKKCIAIAPNRTKAARARAAEINAFIATQTTELRHTIRSLELSGEPFTPRDITATYRRRGDRSYLHTFVVSLCEEMERQQKLGTAGTYRAMLSVFEKFTGGRDTRLHELTPVRLVGFEDYLKRVPLQRNTITFYMRILRAVYNKARRAGLVEKGKTPFEEVSFRIDKTRKRAIRPDTLLRIAEADFGDRTWLTLARDLFMFSFYARGMSYVDLAFLTRDAVQGDIMQYTRQKTGQVFTVRVTPPLRELMARYAECAPWMLPVMIGGAVCRDDAAPRPDLEPDTPQKELYKRYKDTLTDYWYYLGVISEELCTEKRLTFNVARHSWASLARDRGIPVSVISAGMGHTSEKTTAIYLDELDAREVDNANDIVTRL
ncbi:phage integrase SAM-like domain-containing protein [Rikenella microfusus]